MVKDGEKWFAPDVLWRDVDVNSADIPKLLLRRFEGFYIGPAEMLLDRSYDFAAGVLLISALDAIARLLTGITATGDRIREAAEEMGLDRRHARAFYDCYRNGLLHEARI